MHIFGGVLVPEERITNEHWTLHLPTLTWSPLTLDTNDDISTNSSLFNSSDDDDASDNVSMETTNQNAAGLPLHVRSHTAHVVGMTMVVIFGQTKTDQSFIDFVQEYNFGECSIPFQCDYEVRELSLFHSSHGGVVSPQSEWSKTQRQNGPLISV